MRLTFAEPYPDRLKQMLTPRDADVWRLIVAPVQQCPLEECDVLEAGDFPFIDSSHVSKFGSYLNFLFSSVPPRLRRGVLVHIHDVCYPFDYPLAWLKQGRAWNEIYLLRA